MHSLADKSQKNKNQTKPKGEVEAKKTSKAAVQFADHRPETAAHRKLQNVANNAQNKSGIVQLKKVVQLKEQDALHLAKTLHPKKKAYASIQELIDNKLEFSKEDWESIVLAYNRGLATGQPRLRAVYPEVKKEVATSKKPSKNKYVGYDNHGNTFQATTMQKIGERLQDTIHSIVHHAPDLASTGVEMATHTVDAKALYTATSEFINAIKATGGDLSAGDYKSLAVHLVDAMAGAVRSGASVASVTHHVSGALAQYGTGIPGIGYLVKLTGDGMWYSAEYVRKKFRKVMDPKILKDPTHKKRIGKMD